MDAKPDADSNRTPATEVSRLLAGVRSGDPGARDALLPLVYSELKGIARNALKGRDAHTLQPTALLHEAYFRLFGSAAGRAADRREFFGLAARVMRDLLVDHARRKGAGKRGGGQRAVTLREGAASGAEMNVDLLDLDDALRGLSELDDRMARVAELKLFAQLEMAEIAGVLDISKATAERDWRSARAWLAVRLEGQIP